MYLLRQRHRIHYIHLSTTHMNTLVETLSVVTSFTINPAYRTKRVANLIP